MAKMVGFDNVLHSRNHRDVTAYKYSEYEDEFIKDIKSGDKLGIQTDIFVYPYGAYNTYCFNVMKWLGINLGVGISSSTPNMKYVSPYIVRRTVFSISYPIEQVLGEIV